MNSLLAVFRFELKRIMTPGRAFWWLLVAAFPIAITLLLRTYVDPRLSGPQNSQQQIIQKEFEQAIQQQQDQMQQRLEQGGDLSPQQRQSFRQWQRNAAAAERYRKQNAPMTADQLSTLYTVAIYFLAPSIACMLGALLTAAPSVASELEQHSWIYLATRPNGLFHLVMGKYLVAVLWAASATVVGVIVSIPFSRIIPVWQNGSALVGLSVISAMCYSALYLMMGTLFPQRAMVFCVAYTAGVELFMGSIPAVINRLTIQYRLRSLLFHWTDNIQLPDSSMLQLVASEEGFLMQIMWLLSFTAIFLSVALACVQVREFTTAVESDV